MSYNLKFLPSAVNCNSERIPRSLLRVSERIKKQAEFHTVEDSLQLAAGSFKEWRKLDSTIRKQFKKKLAQRLESPHVVSAQLRGYKDYYKIKLRAAGYRLAYRVIEKKVVVIVVGIGKRERVYEILKQRLKKIKG